MKMFILDHILLLRIHYYYYDSIHFFICYFFSSWPGYNLWKMCYYYYDGIQEYAIVTILVPKLNTIYVKCE